VTSRELNRLRAAAGQRLRHRLGIVALAAKVNRLNLELGKLSERDGDVLARLEAAERELKRSRKRRERLAKDSEAVLDRLEAAERELQVWRYMAWLERVRPASERLVSVITPTRNRAETLERCIDSVLAQAHTEFELIVVDDGSEDATPEMLARYSDPRVRSLRIDHAGVSAARNRGLERATGAVVAYLDDDNLMDPLWLTAVANTFDRHPKISLLYGARLIDNWRPPAQKQYDRSPRLAFAPFDRERLMGAITDTNVIAHRRDHPEARFDEDLRGLEDWDLIFRLTRDCTPYELPAIACVYSTRATGRLSVRRSDVMRDQIARVSAKHGLSPPPFAQPKDDPAPPKPRAP
jgi:hypothetical protein